MSRAFDPRIATGVAGFGSTGRLGDCATGRLGDYDGGAALGDPRAWEKQMHAQCANQAMPEREREIPTLMECVLARTDLANEALARLFEGLHPVCNLNQLPTEARKDAKPCATVLGCQLAEAASRLDRIINALNEATASLEL